MPSPTSCCSTVLPESDDPRPVALGRTPVAFKRTKAARGGIDALEAAPAIVLVRPQLAENVGTTARAMLNFGLGELRLVAPGFGWPNAKAVAAASGAAEVLNRMRVFGTVAEAVADLQHVYATTARDRGLVKEQHDAASAAAAARAQVAAGRRVGLLFGPERTGLDNDELELADGLVRIDVNPLFPSLNLAQAVLLCAYEWRRQGAGPAAITTPEPAPKAALDGLLRHLLVELEAAGFFRSPDRRDSLGRAIGAMVERMRLTTPEVQLMRGIVKELRRGPLQRTDDPAG